MPPMKFLRTSAGMFIAPVSSNQHHVDLGLSLEGGRESLVTTALLIVIQSHRGRLGGGTLFANGGCSQLFVLLLKEYGLSNTLILSTDVGCLTHAVFLRHTFLGHFRRRPSPDFAVQLGLLLLDLFFYFFFGGQEVLLILVFDTT